MTTIVRTPGSGRPALRGALTALLERYDDIVLDPDQPYPETSGLRFRQMDGLPVVVTT